MTNSISSNISYMQESLFNTVIDNLNPFVYDKKSQKALMCSGSIPLFVQIHGGKCLDFIFSIIENAGWNRESNGYATYVLRSLKEVC